MVRRRPRLTELERSRSGLCLSCDGTTLDAILVEGGSGLESFAMGVQDGAAFDAYERVLADGGLDYERLDVADRPGIAELLRHRLPGGHLFEVALGSDDPSGITNHDWTGGPTPLGLDHVSLAVEDIEKNATYLRDALGWQLSEVLAPGTAWLIAFMRVGPEHHDVGIVHLPDGLSTHHVALGVAGTEHHQVIADRLIETGHAIEWGPGRHGGPSHNLFLYAFDPSGNRIEFVGDMGILDEGQDTIWVGADAVPGVLNRWTPGVVPEPFFVTGS